MSSLSEKREETTASAGPDAADKAFRRKVRRHVQAGLRRFCAVVPAELVPLCRHELVALGIEVKEISEAGVEFTGKLDACYRANLQLRTASRVLCRMAEFRTGAVEELFSRTVSIPWELWISLEVPVLLGIHVARSRIRHEGKAGQAVADALRRRFQQVAPRSGNREGNPPMLEYGPDAEHEAPAENGASGGGSSPLEEINQRIFVRIEDNHCRISLDTSGPHLHQRGYRRRHAGAPLRETLAAAILMKSGWQSDRPLLDGMCGSGTFAVEAAMTARNIAPGLNRSFLFEKWPSLMEKTWNHLRRKAEESIRPRSPVPIVALDVDPEAVALARQNARRAGVEGDIRWIVADFLSFDPASLNLPPGLLVLNPPYGIRLAEGGPAFYRELGRAIQRHFRGWQAAILAPHGSFLAALQLGSFRRWRVRHGGMSAEVGFFRLR